MAKKSKVTIGSLGLDRYLQTAYRDGHEQLQRLFDSLANGPAIVLTRGRTLRPIDLGYFIMKKQYYGKSRFRVMTKSEMEGEVVVLVLESSNTH